jgi:uncharacterized protein (TIGR02996 family)
MLKSLDLTLIDREWLGRILAQPAELSPRLAYAQVLEQDGEQLRAQIVRLTCSALALEDISGLGALLDQLPEHQIGWSRLIGAKLIAEMEKRHLSKYVPRWMPHVLPALSADVAPCTEPLPVGSSFFWGDPDLPEDFEWPDYANCLRFFDEFPECDPAPKCHFIGQFNLAGIGPAMFGTCGLDQGLLSVFAFDEYDNYGISEVAIFLFPDVSRLRRVKHPVLDEANSPRPCHRVSLEYGLTIPESYEGPWSEQMAVAEGDGDDTAYCSAHGHVLCESGGGRFGLFGHLQATTGRDPTPDASWQRLLCVPGGEDRVIWHHVAVRREDLVAGNIAGCRAVWVDMDG